MERRLQLWAAALVLFVLGGAAGGWWYLSGHLVGEAQAVTSNCGPGRTCSVNTLTVTGGRPEGGNTAASSTSTTKIGSYGVGTAAIWMVETAPTVQNYSLAGDGFNTFVNAGGGAVFFSSSSVTTGSVNSSGTFTSPAASGANGFACSTTGCRFDLGGGASDYFYSDGTNLVAANTMEGDGSPAFHATGAGGVRIGGVATGSLPTCDGSQAGLIHYDTTANALKYCNGTNYVSLSADTDTDTDAETLQGFTDLATAEEQPFQAGIAGNAGTVNEPRFTVTTAGAGAGNAVLELYDSSAATQRATLTFACTAAAGVITSSASTPSPGVVAGNTLVWQWDSSSGCTTLPQGNAHISWE